MDPGAGLLRIGVFCRNERAFEDLVWHEPFNGKSGYHRWSILPTLFPLPFPAIAAMLVRSWFQPKQTPSTEP
jgi:hypothetical protein